MSDQVRQAVLDRQAMFAAQEPVSGPVTLEEATARALKYNLQHRLTLLERALEDRLTDVGAMDLLPKLAARAGLRTRSNVAASVSESVATGQVSLEPSVSQDKGLGTADLQLSWSVLDFGLSYYAARAQSNKALAAEERRRRVALAISEQVRAAYWEAATAERLGPDVGRVLGEAKAALAQAREAEERRLSPPMESLRYQKALLEVVQQLEAMGAELAVARAQLASLMNLPPGAAFQVAVPPEAGLAPPRLPFRLEDMEAMAMVRRPEVREEAYLARTAALEARMAVVRLLPGATLFAGLNADSNSYLVNNGWADAGVQVSWNLLGALAIPRVQEANEARALVADARRRALRMAVLTQVNLAWRRHERAALLFERSSALQEVERRIYQQTASAAASSAQTALERVRAGASALLATRARDRAYAELQNALGAMQQSAGIDPLPDTLEAGDLAAVARDIAEHARRIQDGQVDVPNLEPAAMPAGTR